VLISSSANGKLSIFAYSLFYMHRYQAVLNSDSINRDNYKFTVGALEDALFENAVYGIPSLLGHDSHKPIGWIFPFGLYFEPKLTRLFGEFHIAETPEDREIIHSAYKRELTQRLSEACEPYLAEFCKLLKGALSESAKYTFNGCVAYHDKNTD